MNHGSPTLTDALRKKKIALWEVEEDEFEELEDDEGLRRWPLDFIG
jgi:hypothetical protein